MCAGRWNHRTPPDGRLRVCPPNPHTHTLVHARAHTRTHTPGFAAAAAIAAAAAAAGGGTPCHRGRPRTPRAVVGCPGGGNRRPHASPRGERIAGQLLRQWSCVKHTHAHAHRGTPGWRSCAAHLRQQEQQLAAAVRSVHCRCGARASAPLARHWRTYIAGARTKWRNNGEAECKPQRVLLDVGNYRSLLTFEQ